MSSILIEIDNQVEPDEFAIENSKVEQVKAKSELIWYLFKTSIEYKQLVKNPQYDKTSEIKQCICLYGETSDRSKAKKYITALCNPEYSETIKLNEISFQKLQNNHYLNDLIRLHQVSLMIQDDSKLIIEGVTNSVLKCKSEIETNLDEKMDQDDVIVIDSYEIFDSTNQIRPNRKMEDFTSFRCDNKLAESNNKNLNTKWNDQLVRTALENGFKIDEILKAFKELDSKMMGEYELIEYLKSTRAFKSEDDDLDIIEIAPSTSTKEKTNELKETSKLIGEKSMKNTENRKNKNQLQVEEHDCFALDSDSIMVIETSPPKPNFKSNLTKQPVYNPALYQDNYETKHHEIDHNDKTKSKDSKNLKPIFKTNFKHRSRSLVKSNTSNKRNLSNQVDSKDNLRNSSQSSFNTNHNSTSKDPYIIIDGSNIAREHGKESGRASFSCKGVKIAVEHFLQRGHNQIKAFVPRFRRGSSDKEIPTTNPEILDELEAKGYLTYTPSRYVNNKLIIPYDDRFILKAAIHYNAIIVSNDNYRDLQKENPLWKKHIEACLLQYSFVGDLFMVADDPLGRRGPNLDQFLSFNSKNLKHNTSSITIESNKKTNYNNHNNPNQTNNNTNYNKTKRNSEQTSSLFNKLSDIFPNNSDAIKKLLNQNPSHFDINFFTTKLLDN